MKARENISEETHARRLALAAPERLFFRTDGNLIIDFINEDETENSI